MSSTTPEAQPPALRTPADSGPGAAQPPVPDGGYGDNGDGGSGEMPPVPDAIREAARLAPDHWFGVVDPTWEGEGTPPEWARIGQWRSDADGEIVEWQANPEYKPSPYALEWPEATDAVDEAVRLAATGYGPAEDVTAALATAEVAVFRAPGGGLLSALAPDEQTPVVPVFTSPEYLEYAGRLAYETLMVPDLLARLPEGHEIFLNPSAPVSMSVNTDALREAIAAARTAAADGGPAAPAQAPPPRRSGTGPATPAQAPAAPAAPAAPRSLRPRPPVGRPGPRGPRGSPPARPVPPPPPARPARTSGTCRDGGGRRRGHHVVPAGWPARPPPLRADGTPYRYEMIHDGGARRTYADEPAALLGALLPGYADLADPVDAARARIGHAVRTQVTTQAAVNVEAGSEGCTPEQWELLNGDRDRQPEPAEWSAPVPLLLVDCFYAPITDVPVPAAVPPGEILWLRTRTEEAYLRSLARLGVIVLAERTPSAETSAETAAETAAEPSAEPAAGPFTEPPAAPPAEPSAAQETGPAPAGHPADQPDSRPDEGE
ncbi:type VII secretion system-associated protein [Actinacidiphila yeochonensis]|uniref:type VII secretion system-associated protein n=1 Tax=Actinacidiphila yeochonensis TaxID=89050 RepID=UPI000AB46E42|nr:type VII secretion system-associated protein [Actinacidiphila yeochonensis]